MLWYGGWCLTCTHYYRDVAQDILANRIYTHFPHWGICHFVTFTIIPVSCYFLAICSLQRLVMCRVKDLLEVLLSIIHRIKEPYKNKGEEHTQDTDEDIQLIPCIVYCLFQLIESKAASIQTYKVLPPFHRHKYKTKRDLPVQVLLFQVGKIMGLLIGWIIFRTPPVIVKMPMLITTSLQESKY